MVRPEYKGPQHEDEGDQEEAAMHEDPKNEEEAIAAVVLLSGGLDSATALAVTRARGRICHALSFSYGQRHHFELQAAGQVARALSAASHHIVTVDLRQLGGSALTDDIEVPKGRSAAEMGTGIPVTYVPARNTLFVAH